MTVTDTAVESRTAVERSMNALRSIVRALRIDSRAIENRIGLSLAQLFVLQELDKRASHSLMDLADRTATHQSSVSIVVKRLADRGLVKRVADSADRRRMQIEVTPEGRQVLRGAPITVQARMISALEAMAPDDQATLANLLDEWVREANIDMTVPSMFHEEPS